MDSKLFRLPTSPNYYQSAHTGIPIDVRNYAKVLLPAPDTRFPGWAGQMSDARLVTDYSAHCSANVPAGKQFPTKQWMQKNATEIIDYSRKRSAEITGAIYPLDKSVVPPPLYTVSCKAGGACEKTATNAAGGLGVGREDSAPELFGTYYNVTGPPAEAPNTPLTSRYEGGRNTLRGLVGPTFS